MERLGKAALSQFKCRDAAGRPAPCEKLEQLLSRLYKEPGSMLCPGPKGYPVICEHKAKEARELLRKEGICQRDDGTYARCGSP